MKYTVHWLQRARDRLAAIWVAGPDRQAVTDAANRIDRDLQTNPQTLGESRGDGTRVYFDLPLAVLFRVHEPTRAVFVLDLWRC
jgi:plasmid stabilization system protein ParE